MIEAEATNLQATKEKLPEGWRWVRLGEVSKRISKGESPEWQGFKYTQNGPRFVRSENVLWGAFSNEPQIYIPLEFHAKLARSKLQSGDVLVNLVGASIGRACVVPKSLGEANVNQAVGVITPDETLDAEFLVWYIISPQIRKYFQSVQVEVARPNISLSNLRELLICLPPLDEQKYIAATLNEQMAVVQKATTATEAQLEAAKTLPSAFLRAVFDSSEAHRWPRKRFGDIAEITAPQVDPRIPQYGALPHISAENIEGGVCRLKFLNTAAEDGMISGKYLFEAGDVLYSKIRPYLRKALVAEFQGLCSADMYPIKVRPELLDPYFTAWILISDEFTEHADRESRRARMPKLNREQVFAWEAPVPPLSEQRQIVTMLAEQMKLVERTQKAIEEELVTLNTLLKALLEQLFSGKS